MFKPYLSSNKTLQLTLHAAFWLLIFSLPFLMRPPTPDPSNFPARPPRAVLNFFYVLKAVVWIAFFYLNTYIFIPFLFYKKRYFLFVLMHGAILVMTVVIRWMDIRATGMPFQFAPSRLFVNNFMQYFFFLAGSITLRLLLDRFENDKVMKEKETENLKTELSFLRSQISPHFMFNVLNNMVALARKRSDVLEPSLIKLSSIMRYMLYEIDEEKVPLGKEVEYLGNYIDLQMQRFNKSIHVDVDIASIDNAYLIEPMLLIPLVENSFKHSTGSNSGHIIIQLDANNGELHFSVKNTYNPLAQQAKDKTSGIGLENLRRRLELLYKNNHRLSIQKNEGWFEISLNLKFY